MKSTEHAVVVFVESHDEITGAEAAEHVNAHLATYGYTSSGHGFGYKETRELPLLSEQRLTQMIDAASANIVREVRKYADDAVAAVKAEALVKRLLVRIDAEARHQK